MSIFVVMRRAWQRITQAKEKNYLRWNTFTFAGILFIIICGINATKGLEQFMDVLFWDESLYLSRGLSMFDHIPKDWGPSYSLWYKLLSYFISDRVELYYFNFKLTTILISVAFFLLLQASGVQRILAFVFAVFFLSSFINMPLWPRVSHYCIIVIITGIIIAKYFQSSVSKLVVYSLALLVCAFARPELFLTFLICWILTYIFFFAKIKSLDKYDIALVVLLTGISVFTYVFFKTPFNNGDSARSIGVFLQHFAMNYSQWHHTNTPFWLDYADILRQNFDNHTSLKGIIQSNPEIIKKHFLSNISNYSIQTGKVIFSFFAPIFTKNIHWLCLMVSGMLFAIYFSQTKTIKDKRKKFFELVNGNPFTLFVLFILAAPSFIVCIYAYPRAHYILLQVPFMLLVIALAISSITVEIHKSVQKIAVIAVVWFFVMPSSEDFKYFDLFRNDETLSNLKSVQYIKNNFTQKDTIHVFDVEGGLTNLLPANFVNNNHVFLRDRDTLLLSKFLLSNKFDIIYKTPTLKMLNSVQKDTVLFDILKNPAKYGYLEEKTGNFEPSLLIKQH
jgi:hypothetical protein